MKSGIIFRLEVPHREAMSIRGFLFGGEKAARTCAIIGSTRGNEVQQAFICANIVARLRRLEAVGALVPGKGVLVIPCANPYAMNVLKRFWPGDDTDINRMFPGDERGDTTQRIAWALMRVVGTHDFGIQLCSFHQPGDFLPHVRVIYHGPVSDEALKLAPDFRLPYVLRRQPLPPDTATLSYALQEQGRHAFSLYSQATDRIDEDSARMVESAVLRFLERRGVLNLPEGELADAGVTSLRLAEEELVDVRTGEGGFFQPAVSVGERVVRGQTLACVRDAFDAHALETLVSPVDGQVFFLRTEPLVQQHMTMVRIAANA